MSAKVLLIAIALCAVTCKSSREPLPGLEAPPLEGSRVEVLYIWAHYRPLIRSLMARDDIRFDKDLQFHHHHFWVIADLRAWRHQTGVGRAWMDEYLMQTLVAWTPDARKFKGARERAVAVGLLAHSLYRQHPPETDPTFAQLRACARGIRDETCVLSPRDRALKRMILIGQYADKALFDQLVATARERRESGAPRPYSDDFYPPGSAERGGSLAESPDDAAVFDAAVSAPPGPTTSREQSSAP